MAKKYKFFRAPFELDEEVKQIQKRFSTSYGINVSKVQALRFIVWKSKNYRIPITKELIYKIIFG